MKKIIVFGLLALSVLLFGEVTQAVTPDASSGATVSVSDDNGVVWTEENTVPIFKDAVFYPGYKHDYWFTVKNTNARPIEYRMVFHLKDESGVPLDIEVSRDDKVIFDHQTANKETEETVESEVLNLPAGATFSYHFKIAWHEDILTDAEDTAHGLEAMTKNKATSVNFYFEKPDRSGEKTDSSGTSNVNNANTDNTLDKTADGNTQPIGQQLADTLGQQLPTTFGKLGEVKTILVSLLGGAIVLIFGIILWKRRKADEEN